MRPVLLALVTVVSTCASAEFAESSGGVEFTACLAFTPPEGQFTAVGRPVTCMELFLAEPDDVRDVAYFFIENALREFHGSPLETAVDPADIEALIPYVGEQLTTRLGGPSDVETSSRQGFACPCVRIPSAAQKRAPIQPYGPGVRSAAHTLLCSCLRRAPCARIDVWADPSAWLPSRPLGRRYSMPAPDVQHAARVRPVLACLVRYLVGAALP